MKVQIEIFTAGCPFCEPVVELVKTTASENSEIVVYDLSKSSEDILTKAKTYGVERLPAIAVEGKLLGCCKNIAITKEDLINAGIAS